MKVTNLLRGFVLSLGGIGLASCLALPKDEDATLAFYQVAADTLDTTEGIVAFEQTFYAFARDNCVSCHGGTIAPYFAVDDVNMAYAAAKDSQYVNFQSPSGSKLAVYSGNGHCGVIGCANNSSVAAQRIQSWAAVELAAVENPGGGGGDPTTPTLPGTGGPATGGVNPGARVTTTLALPNLPTNGTYVPLRWELSQLNPSTPLVGNALFEIEAQRLSDTTYRVRNPRIVGLTAPIRLTNIHIYVKPVGDPGVGVEDVGAGTVWSNNLISNVPTSTRPANLPNGPITAVAALSPYAMVIGVRSAADAFTIAFDNISSGAALTGTFTSVFENILLPRCVSCHSADVSFAGVRYDTYQNARVTALNGRLVGSTTGANATMPPSGAKLNTLELNAINAWIQAGAPNN